MKVPILLINNDMSTVIANVITGPNCSLPDTVRHGDRFYGFAYRNMVNDTDMRVYLETSPDEYIVVFTDEELKILQENGDLT